MVPPARWRVHPLGAGRARRDRESRPAGLPVAGGSDARQRHGRGARRDRRSDLTAATMTYLTEERRLIQQTAREFSLKEVLPIANELDKVKGDIPMALRDQMAELGYFGIRIAEEHGGLGLGVFEYCLITEELARGWMSVASIIARGNGLGGGFSVEQQRKYLPRMARGEF